MPVKQITITQALAEIRTLKARVSKQYEFVNQNLAYPSNMVDPLAHNGGSVEAIKRARQSISDMQERIVFLRVAIGRVNDAESLALAGDTRTISGWLAWKREVAPDIRRTLAGFRTGIDARRNTLNNEIHRINQQRNKAETPLQIDVIPAINEGDLSMEIDRFEKIWGELDGELSMRNSRITLEVPA